MQTEYVYPKIGNRMSPKEWNAADKPELLSMAKERKRDILREAISTIPALLDEEIRKKWRMYFL